MPEDIKTDSQATGKKRIITPIVLACISSLFFAGSVLCAYHYYQEHRRVAHMLRVVDDSAFYQGILIDGIPVEGLSFQQAQTLLQAHEDEQTQRYHVTVNIEGEVFEKEIPVTTNLSYTLEEAYAFGREGDLEARYAMVEHLRWNPLDWRIVYTPQADTINDMVAQMAARLNVQAADAQVSGFDEETKAFVFTDEVQGATLREGEILDQFAAALEEDAFPVVIWGKLDTIEPEIKRAELEMNYRLLASFTTKTTSSTSRNTNIRLATEAFSGTVIKPGETFSINAATGERSKAKGYQVAGAIQGGRLVSETGGGVCQVSTTLFNAAVRAGLTIAERYNHSYPIDYVPRGHDAMINYPTSDLKLTNNGTGPVYLVGYFADRQLTIEVYGEPILEEGVQVELRADTVENLGMPREIARYDPRYAAGYRSVSRRGRTGYKVDTYIQYVRDGVTVEEKLLFNSYYRPIAPIVVYGSAG